MKRIMMMLLVLAAALWAEPSPAQVKAAVDSGNYVQAESLLKEVIKAHPESAKAHYMLAQVLAREGNYNQAKAELSQAKTLDPKMAFGSASAIASFESKLATAIQGGSTSATTSTASQESKSSSSVWIWIMIGAVILFIVWLMRRRRSALPPAMGGSYNNNGAPYNNGYGNNGYGNNGYGGSGMGSSLMSGLAMGAGAAAGMALVDSLLDGNEAHASETPPISDTSASSDFGSFDMDSGGDWGDSGGGDSDSW